MSSTSSRNYGYMQMSKAVYCAAAALSFACMIVVFYHPISVVVSYWGKPEYSHGPLVVAVALFLIWQILAKKKPAVSPSWLGAIFVLPAGLLFALGDLSTFNSAGAYGYILANVAICLAFFGRSLTVAIAPAFIYMCFAVPLPATIFGALSTELQLLSSTMGERLLDFMGLAVFQEGNIIDLGVLKLQVAEACSGLRYMFPLMSFGFLVAYFLEDAWWKRIFLFFSTIPITILMNVLRIALIGVTADEWGPEMAQGFLHEFEGWTVFLICVACLAAEMWLLLKIPPYGRIRTEYLSLPRGPVSLGYAVTWRHGGIALALSVAAAAALQGSSLASQMEIIPPHRALTQFPLEMGGWVGRSETLDPDTLAALKVDDYYLASYRSAGNESPVELYVAYYSTQQMGAEIHSPMDCIPGGGWFIAKSEVKVLSVPWDASHPLTVNRLLIRKGELSQLVYYWLDERGNNVTSGYSVKWGLLRDSVIKHRSDGSLIRIVTPLANPGDEARADERMKDFVTLATPVLQQYLPGPELLTAKAASSPRPES